MGDETRLIKDLNDLEKQRLLNWCRKQPFGQDAKLSKDGTLITNLLAFNDDFNDFRMSFNVAGDVVTWLRA